ncbi:MAG: PH domain-containing protein [Micromonosporaceae bacterium]
MRTVPPAVEPRRRLHPLTPLLRGARSFAVVVAGISLQGFLQLGFQRGVIVVLLAVLGTLVLSWVSWWYTGYHVVNRELRVSEGLIWRRNRAIALERLQSVEVVRPLLARLTGLAELRLEVVGGAQTEAPLAFLTVSQAYTLRDRLLTISTGADRPAPASELGTAAPGTAEPGAAGLVPDAEASAAQPTAAQPTAARPTVSGPSADEPEEVLHRVPTRQLLVGQLLTPQALAAPFTLAASVVMFAVNPNLTLVGIIGAFTATVGIALQPIRRAITEYGFTVGETSRGLRLRYGLTETRHQTVPAGRVQAIAVTWPLLWRSQGWLRCRIDVAGATGGDERAVGGTLLPVAAPHVAQRVIGRVLPEVDVAKLPVVAVPPKARYRAPLRYRVFAAGLTDRVFAAYSGLLTRRLAVVPYQRIQSVRVVQGPWQRWLGLASVHVDTAGRSIAAVAEHRDLDEAYRMAEQLTDRARLARHADPDR